MPAFTKKELVEMWKRPVERQYNIALSKILEAINETEGNISICFSGGKDSSLLLDMYCEVVKTTPYKNKPIQVKYADTTNETSAMRQFVKFFIPYIQQKHQVEIQLQTVRPPNGLVWARFVLENGIPIISKEQAKTIRVVKRDMLKTGCDYETVQKLWRQDMSAVNALVEMGFSKTSILALTGYVTRRDAFGRMCRISKRWLPMVNCPTNLTELCCVKIKEAALDALGGDNIMTGEQASESKNRETKYLKTGCNIRLPDGTYKSKPFGAMTLNGILFALKFRNIPICPDYGEIVCENNCYTCTKVNRTGCALCGFGCQYDVNRFVRLQETEPAKIKFAFKPLSQNGAGYLEAVQYMNEYCNTDVKIPQI